MVTMKILILSDPIVPPIGSPRMMTTCRYLKEAGHVCVMETETFPGFQNLFLWCIDKLFWIRDIRFSKYILQKYSRDSFDVILCSTYYYFPILAAKLVSEKWNVPLVLDFRDIAEQFGDTSYFSTSVPHFFGLGSLMGKMYERMNIRRRNQIIRRAQIVTTISPWHREFLQKIAQAPVELVYNGFDENEIQPRFYPTNIFRISYIGRIINLKLRQPALLFEALGEMLSNGEIDIEHFKLEFFSEHDFEIPVRNMAREYGIDGLLVWEKLFSREHLTEVISRSSVLLAFGRKAKEQHGILGTKVFEAIGAEKPFLLVPSDEDSLASLIRECGIGCAARNTEEIKWFIRKQYGQWRADGYTRCTIASKNRFSRRIEAQQFETILYGLTK